VSRPNLELDLLALQHLFQAFGIPPRCALGLPKLPQLQQHLFDLTVRHKSHSYLTGWAGCRLPAKALHGAKAKLHYTGKRRSHIQL
jgi:hypothetical protein